MQPSISKFEIGNLHKFISTTASHNVIFADIQEEVSKKVMEEGGQSPFNLRIWLWTIKTWQHSMRDLSVDCFKDEKYS
jgi:hypothetical protein